MAAGAGPAFSAPMERREPGQAPAAIWRGEAGMSAGWRIERGAAGARIADCGDSQSTQEWRKSAAFRYSLPSWSNSSAMVSSATVSASS